MGTAEIAGDGRDASGAATTRVASIDLLRGLVMVVMALDHVRDFFSPFPWQPEDLSQASAGLFLTRWVTHFCAPVFVFLAGTSAWLYRRNTGCTRGELQWFLLTRGLWLVVLELTLIHFGWSFSFGGGVGLQVFWALGWSMVFLAGALYLPLPAIIGLGALMVVGHNALDGIPVERFGELWWVWALLHVQTFTQTDGGFFIAIVYPLVPWLGVMALGYGFGLVVERPARERDRFLLWAGVAMIAAFLLLRLTNLYGEPQPFEPNPRGALYTALNALNTSKYPPSLLYLLMTLGPALLLMPLLEHWRGRLAEAVSVFGRVPLFYYLLHLPLIHAVSALWTKLAYGEALQAFGPPPPGFEPSLLRVYLVWAAVVVVLYFPCRWYAGYKKAHKDNRWLSYL